LLKTKIVFFSKYPYLLLGLNRIWNRIDVKIRLMNIDANQ